MSGYDAQLAAEADLDECRDRLAQARADLAAAQAREARVRALHRPRQNTSGLPDACPDCLGGIHAADPDAARPCGCWGLSTPVCGVCSDPSAVTGRRYAIQWPCPTDRALDGTDGGAG